MPTSDRMCITNVKANCAEEIFNRLEGQRIVYGISTFAFILNRLTRQSVKESTVNLIYAGPECVTFVFMNDARMTFIHLPKLRFIPKIYINFII